MSQSVDGKALAENVYTEIRQQVRQLGKAPRLAIITCDPDFATKKYLALKQAKAKAVGFSVTVCELSEVVSTEIVVEKINSLTPEVDAIIVQLPLPPIINLDIVLANIPPSHDADALNPKTTSLVWSPVVAACAYILDKAKVEIANRHATVVGSGRLVGQPIYRWLNIKGAAVSLVTKDTKDIGYYTRPADIVVSGAGVPGLITPDLIKPGAVVLDAGTAEADGELRGDADPACLAKASLFTPVPGGIGPLTVAFLLKNVVTLALSRKKD